MKLLISSNGAYTSRSLRDCRMTEDWLGCRVSLDCGSLGHFQGVISRTDLEQQTVTLQKPFQNGVACKFPEITLNGTDIQVSASSGEVV